READLPTVPEAGGRRVLRIPDRLAWGPRVRGRPPFPSQPEAQQAGVESDVVEVLVVLVVLDGRHERGHGRVHELPIPEQAPEERDGRAGRAEAEEGQLAP